MFSSRLVKPRTAIARNGFLGGLGFSGSKSKAGLHITPEAALGINAFYACIKLLSDSIAQLPCELYRRTGKKGEREKAADYYLYDKIRHAPNGWMTAFDYQSYTQTCEEMRGNQVSFIEWSNGRVDNIIPINPAEVQLKIGSNRQPIYDFIIEGQKDISFENIHHVAGFKINPYWGMSPVQAGRESLGLAMATEHHASNVFSSGTSVKGVLERPAVLSGKGLKGLEEDQIKSIKKQFKEIYSGLDGDDVAFLQDGIQFKSISMSNEDAQLLASRAYSVTEIARLFGIAPHMIQHLENMTLNNIEHLALQYVMYAILPRVRRREAAMHRDLLTKKERKDYYIEFNVTSLLRGDMSTRFNSYAQAITNGWMSVNEVRRLENLPPINGGDKLWRPLNMTYQDEQGHLEKVNKDVPSDIQQQLDQIRQQVENAD